MKIILAISLYIGLFFGGKKCTEGVGIKDGNVVYVVSIVASVSLQRDFKKISELKIGNCSHKRLDSPIKHSFYLRAVSRKR